MDGTESSEESINQEEWEKGREKENGKLEWRKR